MRSAPTNARLLSPSPEQARNDLDLTVACAAPDTRPTPDGIHPAPDSHVMFVARASWRSQTDVRYRSSP
jgi:hypothetical protein